MNDKYKLFNDKGYVLFKQFIKNDSFNEICNNLKNDILDVYKNTDRKLSIHFGNSENKPV